MDGWAGEGRVRGTHVGELVTLTVAIEAVSNDPPDNRILF